MPHYAFDQLDVYGCLGMSGTSMVPKVCLPLIGVKGTDLIAEPHAKTEREFTVEAEVEEGLMSVLFHATQDGDVLFDPPLPMKPNHCIYVGPDTERQEYVSYTDALMRIRSFTNEKRSVGDARYREGKMREALAAFELGAAASQTPADYARMLLTKLLSDERRDRIVKAIRDVEPNVDLEVLCNRVLRDITVEAP